MTRRCPHCRREVVGRPNKVYCTRSCKQAAYRRYAQGVPADTHAENGRRGRVRLAEKTKLEQLLEEAFASGKLAGQTEEKLRNALALVLNEAA